MNEPQHAAPQEQAVTPDAGVPGATTAGRLIAALRTQEGVHLAALAATLKVPEHRLEALEADRYEEFPDTVFLRALASGVCRALKRDAAPVLALLPRSTPVPLKNQSGLNASYRQEGERANMVSSLGLPMPRVMAFAVIALLAAALVIAFFPQTTDEAGAPASPTADAVQPAASAQSSVAATPPLEALEPPAPPVEAAPAAEAPTEQPANETLAAQAPAEPVHVEPLVIEARQQTWVQVRDAGGKVLMEKTMEQGNRFVDEGTGPWSVIIGRADAASVTVRGQPVDLGAVARNNVARFEVK